MTVIGALSSFRELGEMSPHKRAQVHLFTLTICRRFVEVVVGTGTLTTRFYLCGIRFICSA